MVLVMPPYGGRPRITKMLKDYLVTLVAVAEELRAQPYGEV